MITARSTRVFALLGDPVAHSLSPVMHNAGFRAAGVDAVYVALACGESELSGVMRTLAANGGGGNVTVPHKTAAARTGRAEALVADLGVANVFGSDGGELVVGNTDVEGLLALLARLGAAEGPWCVLGTGGSARAVVGAARVRRTAVAVRSRSPERGAAFGAWAESIGVPLASAAECRVLINATPVGLRHDDPPPVELDAFPVLQAVADLTYQAAAETALVRSARERGLAAADGREMLLIQGMAAWRHWLDGVEPPEEVMRAALRRAMD